MAIIGLGCLSVSDCGQSPARYAQDGPGRKARCQKAHDWHPCERGAPSARSRSGREDVPRPATNSRPRRALSLWCRCAWWAIRALGILCPQSQQGFVTMMSARNGEPGSPVWRLASLLLGFAVAVAGCSAIGGDEWTEPIPIAALTEQAATVSPAAWAVAPPDGWPATVPAPTFLDNASQVSQSGPDGTRSVALDTSSRPEDDQVTAYIALLLDAGFAPDTRAAQPGWFIRDGFEWVALQNRDASDFVREGFSVNARSFAVQWTTNSAQPGYCRIVESGGASCRE